MQHLFLTCPFVAGLWDAVTSVFGHRIIVNGAVLDLWQNAMKVSFGSQLQGLWRASIVSVFWVLWYFRNRATFDDRIP